MWRFARPLFSRMMGDQRVPQETMTFLAFTITGRMVRSERGPLTPPRGFREVQTPLTPAAVFWP